VTINPKESVEPLRSGVLISPADGMLRRAIAQTLEAPAIDRADLFAGLVRRIEDFMARHPEERPWTCRLYTGTDGSSIFRGGVGHSLVIDADGRLWRARSYEDFETAYAFTGTSCEIDTLTPLYDQMFEYCQRDDGAITAKIDEVYATESSTLDPVIQSIQSRSVKI
jgi:hypothetical protein